MLKILKVLINKGYFEGKKSVIEIGAKDVCESISEIKAFFNTIKLQNIDLYNLIIPYLVDGRLPGRFIWESIGFDIYESIDLFDSTYNSLKFDLNKSLIQEYNFQRKFDVVTNFGCSEHVFDQMKVFENIHNLASKGACIINSIPLKTNLDHSFYSYHPNLFYSLAEANGYEILEFFLENRFIFAEFNYDALNYLNKYLDNLTLTIVYKKQKDDHFVIPYEYKKIQKSNKSDVFKFFENYLLYHGVQKKDSYVCAIFGTGEAGEIAYDFCNKYKIRILSFIDDFKLGFFKSIQIYSRSEFIKMLFSENKCDFVLKGPFQKGIITYDELKLPIIDLPLILLN